MTTAVIADDERLLREQLRARLLEVWPELELAAWKDTYATLHLWTQIEKGTDGSNRLRFLLCAG